MRTYTSLLFVATFGRPLGTDAFSVASVGGLTTPRSSSTVTSTATARVTARVNARATARATAKPHFMAKGFGGGDEKKRRREKSRGQKEREEASARYDSIATTGQEYSIFVRQFGSDDQSWLPCGAIAVPRNAQVSDAIFANETGLRAAIVRTYPKLNGYETEFEYGYNLKVYPDDPVEVAKKGGNKSSGPSLGNWISTLLSPVDASKVPKPPIQEE